VQIAWIGTGIMGAPMARRLLRAGHNVTVFNRTRPRAQGPWATARLSPIAQRKLSAVQR
jgi:3-hydroxyisobutyrate dehydrogenase